MMLQPNALRLIAVPTTMLIIALSVELAVASISFTPLGQLTGGTSSYALDVSANGKVVVGYSNVGGVDRAFRWENGSMQDLGNPAGSGLGHSYASSVSANGSAIAGYANPNIGSNFEAYRWDNGVPTSLPGIVNNTFGFGISSNGTVVVGNSHGSALRWNGPTAVGLPGLLAIYNQASGISDDLSVIVGYGADNTGLGLATRWVNDVVDPAGGLGTLSGHNNSLARDVSGNGEVIVGWSGIYNAPNYSYYEAFRWENGTMLGLGTLAGDSFSDAFGASSDGSIVVGASYAGSISNLQPHAFIWDGANGIRSLQDLLTSEGIDLTGWELHDARSVSADGYVITGFGRNPNGEIEAWIADFTPDNGVVPEATSFLIWGLLGLTFAGGWKHRSRK